MEYPKFLQRKNVIGITALSSGAGNTIKEVKLSLNHLKEKYRLIITPNVYGEEIVSSSKEERIKELNELLQEDINMLINIRGGDFLYEVLDDINYLEIKKKKLLVMGYSDITPLLYILTTKYDLATVYGLNGKSFDSEILEDYQLNNLKILEGNLIVQKSFLKGKTQSINGNFTSKGLLIGGCLDILRFLFGTDYDYTKNFLEKYQKYGIIWYFDIFSMGSVDVYLTMLQMQKMGYFKYSNTILFGSVLFPKVECNMEYYEGIKKVFKDKNIIYNADIGHVKPVFTLINGSLGEISYQNNKLTLKMELLDENNG